MGNKNKFQRKGFSRGKFNTFGKPEKFSSFEKFMNKPVKSVTISEINQDFFNQDVEISGIIGQITQTGGPTIFMASDGTGTLALKGFIGKGERAYPEVNEGDGVKATVTINEYNKELEGEIR